MLRLVHIFDIKSGKSPESFLSWLESTLYAKSKEFGCTERNNWVFLDGMKDPYGRGNKKEKRPKYISEAFWENEKGAEEFRQWLRGPEGLDYRKIWLDNISNHSLLRYVKFTAPLSLGDD